MAILTRRNLLRAGIGAGGIVALSGVGFFAWAGLTYSEGWRMGRLTKFSARSSWRRLYLATTGEGELMLGQDSSGAVWTGADGQEASNPWIFSSSRAFYDDHHALLGRLVCVRYRQVMHRVTAFGGDTDYRAEEIVPVLDAPVGACAVEGRGARSAGERVGRIVKVARKGSLAKSWEITLQEGVVGNRFTEMSALSDEMAACATAYLRAGRLAVVGYRESIVRNPLNRDTNYDITNLRPAEA
jgi:hypothetical protein